MSIQIDIAAELFEVSTDDGLMAFERFYVLLETSQGRRFRHDAAFPAAERADDVEEGIVFWRRVWDATDRAEALAARIRAHLDAGGRLNVDHWVEVDPAYGSDAYIAFEANEIAPAMAFLRNGGSEADLPANIRAHL